jgi:hypothetical protein
MFICEWCGVQNKNKHNFKFFRYKQDWLQHKYMEHGNIRFYWSAKDPPPKNAFCRCHKCFRALDNPECFSTMTYNEYIVFEVMNV